MLIVIIATEEQKEVLMPDLSSEAVVHWIKELPEIYDLPAADAYIDLLFDDSTERTGFLQQLLPSLVFINSVTATLSQTDISFVRFNGWPTFLNGQLTEASGVQYIRQRAQTVWQCLGKELSWLPDVPGFVTPRIISMIISEAFIAEGEGVSTRAEIDTAMKLGTAYPYGPFEWAQEIGIEKIQTLLQTLAVDNPLYSPVAVS